MNTKEEELRLRVTYVGYEVGEDRAPHQAMAAVWLAERAHSVEYLTARRFEPPNWLTAMETLSFVFGHVRSRRLGAVVIALKLVARALSGRTDVLYVQGAQNTVIALAAAVLRRGTTLVYHTQDYKPRITRTYSLAERLLSRMADHVICNEVNRGRVMAAVNRLPENPDVIRTALPANWPVPDVRHAARRDLASRHGLAFGPDDCLIAAGGRYRGRRASYSLLQAVSELPDNYYVVFTGMEAGAPEVADCLAVAEDLSLGRRVIVEKSLRYEELLSLYTACDLGMLLYTDDDIANFYQGPGRLTEYLRAGLPVVASRFPGLELLVLKYSIGATADPDSPSEIAAAVSSLDLPPSRERRAELRELATGLLCYERGADEVLGRIVSDTAGGLRTGSRGHRSSSEGPN